MLVPVLRRVTLSVSPSRNSYRVPFPLVGAGPPPPHPRKTFCGYGVLFFSISAVTFEGSCFCSGSCSCAGCCSCSCCVSCTSSCACSCFCSFSCSYSCSCFCSCSCSCSSWCSCSYSRSCSALAVVPAITLLLLLLFLLNPPDANSILKGADDDFGRIGPNGCLLPGGV